MNHPILACGHAANAVKTATKGVKHDPIPCCAICSVTELAKEQPSLAGRTAKCAYKRVCKSEQPSDPEKLAFFEHKPNEPYDVFYCGCQGWD